MKNQVDGDWWKDIFDDIYLLTDARSVCNEELTKMEVDFLQETLDMDTSSPILDMCGGQGRHSLELTRRGFMKVTVLDYSRYLIALGEKKAKQEELNTVFIQGDARNTDLPGQSFQFCLIMASSFGYFMNEEENKKILKEASRVLMHKGTLLLDLPDREYVVQNFKSFSTHKVNEDITVSRERDLGEDIIYSRERVISAQKGCLRDRTYCTRLYTPEKILELLYSVGFSSITCRKGFMSRATEGDYGCMTNRMIVIAKKGKKPSL
ncbi:MAG: class I SAM-dependent methyltransferase [Deltaproteobacteria bacterium]|nr:class I SAM-dependent methyltransferase [Deltaproteobacteria bacterium]